MSSVPTDSAVLPAATPDPDAPSSTNFIEAIIEEDLRTGATDGRVATRFPPEPNGYLHIGHAKSICLNFGLARAYGGQCHLRFDDTNPTTESLEFVESIKQDVHWLGFDWDTHLYFASDYFEPLYAYAVQLIKDGKAYVDSLNEEAIRDYRGSVTEPGRESPYRIRSVEENLDLFERMRAGEFEDGTHVLRARIDMASPNMLLRDPLLYRIRHAHHYRTGDGWCIYPMYDYAHPLSDAIEGITHSICTLEFEVHRPLYDWVVENTRKPPRPHQYEFARLNLDYTVMSKRKLLQLVNDGHVDGWDDPRMPTLAGLRRRGVTPDAIRAFCDRIGVAKADNRIDIGLLEYCIRDDLNWKAPRVMCVLRPLKVVLTNYPEDRTESMEAPSYPPDVDKDGSRIVPFSRELYIEREDFEEHPPKGFFRLAPGREVRLRYGYIIKCEEVVKDETGEVVELRCTYDPATRSGSDTSGRKVKGTIHWVSATHSLPAEVRLYDRLFRVPNPDVEPGDFIDYLNSNSIEILRTSRVEPSVADDPTGTRYQFTRQGYFTSDRIDSSPDVLVFNRIVTLRDSWAKKTEATKTENTRKASPAPPAPKPKPSSAAEANGSSHEAPELRLDEKNPGLLARFEEYTETLGVPPLQADLLTSDPAIAGFFEDALAVHRNPTALANWVVNEVLRELKDRTLDELPFTGADLGALVALIDDETISTRLAKTVFEDMLETGDAPNAIVERKGLTQVTDPDALAPIVDRLIAEHPDKVEAYRSGKTGLMGFFVGQVMRSTRGKANPQLVQDLVQRALE